MKTSSIYGKASILMVGRGSSFIFTFFLPIFLARTLFPADYGTFKQVFLIFSTLYIVLQGGLVQSLYYFVPREPERRATWVLQTFFLLVCIGVAAGISLLLAGDRLADYFSNPALKGFIPHLAIFTLLMLTSSYLETILTAEEKVTASSAVLFSSEALRALFVLVPLLITRALSPVIEGLVLFSAVRFSASFGYTVYLLFKKPRSPLPLWSPGSLKTQLFYTLPFGAAILVDVLQQNLHQYAVAYLFDPATFAAYSVGMMQLPFVDLVYTPMSEILIVQMGRLLREGTHGERIDLWYATTKRLASLLFPAAVFFGLISSDLIVLFFTETYAESAPLFRISMTTMLPAVFLTEGMLRCHARSTLFLMVPVLKTLLTAFLIFPMIRLFGLTGAVATTVTVFYGGKLIMLWEVRRLLEVSWSRFIPWRDLGRTLLTAFGIAVPLGIIRPLLPLKPFAALIFLTGAYWILLILFLFLSISLSALRSVLSQKEDRFSRLTELLKGSIRQTPQDDACIPFEKDNEEERPLDGKPLSPPGPVTTVSH